MAAWDSEGDTNSTSYARIIIKVEFDDKNKHTPTFDRSESHLKRSEYFT